jgi:hypothetical protein
MPQNTAISNIPARKNPRTHAINHRTIEIVNQAVNYNIPRKSGAKRRRPCARGYKRFHGAFWLVAE